jgi:preprotein translocase subunit YajC
MKLFFINDAMAAGTTAQPDGTFSLIMLIAIFVLFYFMLIRPQNKRAKEHREMVANLKKGDEIVTSGGMLAKVVDIGEQYMRIALAEGVEISIQRNAVSTVLPKGTLKSV